MTTNNTLDSFYHGLVSSKLWLCEKLEEVIRNESIDNPILHILGCWDNLLGFMLVTRQPNLYGVVNGYDIDPTSIEKANLICDTWKYDYPKIYNHCLDINTLNFSNTNKESVFVSCSIDQFEGTKWYDIIPSDRLVCLQSTDVVDSEHPWYNKQYTKDIFELGSRYPLKKTLYAGSKPITYKGFGYNRFMLIGFK